jgi:putative glycosyltransferase (TIGR04372 family)
MMPVNFFKNQLIEVKKNGLIAIGRKLTKIPFYFFKAILVIIAIPIALFIRLIRPLYCIRFGKMISSRIGHFAANTELYLCEKKEGINLKQNIIYIDLFFLGYKPICNKQLVKMWKRKLQIWPAYILEPIYIANKLLPGGKRHEIGENSQADRDIHNLIEKHSPHLSFTKEEEEKGKNLLSKMGINKDDKFVCLIVRDSTYLNNQIKNGNWEYHNYRDCDVLNYKLASEYLAKQGYFVIRMGAIVKDKFLTNSIKIIDYATNGMRTDFMDIYLGAKCLFCISSSLGWDSIPEIFKKPIIYTNILPFGYLRTANANSINLSKQLIYKKNGTELTLSQIFENKLEFATHTNDYISKGIELRENSPEEILDMVIEMEKRLNSDWIEDNNDKLLQDKFWDMYKSYPLYANGAPLHGNIKARYSSHFLRKNLKWLN